MSAHDDAAVPAELSDHDMAPLTLKHVQDQGSRRVGTSIDVVSFSDGGLTTLDNTRLLSAGYSNTPVQGLVHDAGNSIPSGMGRFITSRSRDVPETWQEAVNNRINRQNATYRDTYPEGSSLTGWSGN